jgi:hypothetical protein
MTVQAAVIPVVKPPHRLVMTKERFVGEFTMLANCRYIKTLKVGVETSSAAIVVAHAVLFVLMFAKWSTVTLSIRITAS